MGSRLIHLVAGARPNFVKIAPLYHELERTPGITPRIVNTGQHYDAPMAGDIMFDLGLPTAHHSLGVGSGSHAEQTGKVMVGYESLLQSEIPTATVVVGDINSTVAAAMVCAKAGVPVIHLEAGLRSYDRTMPEEVNRVVTDALADLLWTPSPDADLNLSNEGVAEDKIVRVGNIMLDSLEMLRSGIEEAGVVESMSLTPGEYALCTLHRPFNVDDPDTLKSLCETLSRIARDMDVVLPLHPRTASNLDRFGLREALAGVTCIPPQSYVSFMNLLFSSRLVMTDSGGIQEETTYLGIPCLTLRPNTERPITIDMGTNRLVTPDELEECVKVACSTQVERRKPDLWDGRTASRCARSLSRFLDSF